MILDDIAAYIDNQSTSFTRLSGSAGNLSLGEMPDTAPAPDTITTLYETGGLATLMSFSTTDQAARQFTQHRIQVLCRSTDYVTARQNAETVFVLLDGRARSMPTSTGTFHAVTAVQAPFDIGKDGNQRHLVSTNYDVLRRVPVTEVLTGAYSAAFSTAFDLVGV